MRSIPYDPVPAVLPRTDVPFDYQNIPTEPAEFGADLAQGMQRAGQGATTAAHFFSQVAADDAAGQWQADVSKVLHGDPGKTVIGPDGQPMPDSGYLGLRGRAALAARPTVEQQLDDLRQRYREALSNPEEQLEFDRNTRRYQFYLNDRIGAHADRESRVYFAQVNQAGANLALEHIAANAGNPQEVANGLDQLMRARIRQAQVMGGGNDLIGEAVATSRRDAAEAQIKALLPVDPDRAMQVLNANRGILADSRNYDTLSAALQHASDRKDALDFARRWRLGGGTVPAISAHGAGWGPLAAPAIDALKKAGASPAFIAGAMANGLAEGGFAAPWQQSSNPGEQSFGHWQLNQNGELPGYLAWARGKGDPHDTALQAQYLVHRMEELHPGITRTDDPQAATDAIGTQFERYQGAAPGQRYGYLAEAQRHLAAPGAEAPSPPAGATGRPAAAGFDLAFGDSIAVQQIRHGVAGSEAPFRSPGLGPQGATARIGDTPGQVLARMKAAGPAAFAGKTVFLSPGTSNDPAQLDAIADQVAFLKTAGARAVVIPGVGPGVPNHDQVDARLKQIADTAGFTFFQPDVQWQKDGIHPAEVDKLRDQAVQALRAAPPGSGNGAAPAAALVAPPDLDATVAQILAQRDHGEITDSRAAARIQAVEAEHRRWLVETQGERAGLRHAIAGGIAMLASGRDWQYDPQRIRAIFPAAEADQFLTALDDAKMQGDAMRSVAGSSPEQLAETRTKLQAGLDLNQNPIDFARRARYVSDFERAAERRLADVETEAGQQALAGLRTAPVPAEAAQAGVSAEDLRQFAQGSPEHRALAAQLGQYPSAADAQRRQRILDQFDAAVMRHYHALATDPASYVASFNPDIQAQAQAAAQATDPGQARTLFGAYAESVLGMQEHLGLDPEQQHILGVPQARAIARQLTGDPENAPARFRAMADRFGDYWPRVWGDLATIGKLPGAWQLVGQLADYDPENAGLLARELAQEPKTERGSALNARPAAGGKSIEQQITEAIDGDPRVQLFDRSLANGFVSAAARNAVVGAIGSLAKARYLFVREDPATAAANAVNAAIGHYEFDPRSGARAPADRFDAISSNARARLDGLSPATVAIPPGFGGGAQPTPEDYVAAVKSAGLWVNAPRNDGWWLIDQGGRFVLDRNGRHVAVPFSAGQLAPPPAAPPVAASPAGLF